MRLLHSTSLEFEEFEIEEFETEQRKNPKYAILSHTWGKASDEVSFQELPHLRVATEGQKLGFHKIKRCGEVAAAANIDYIWVDTCCIDKTSSAELTQAINSMYFWYQQAEVCYVYLADFSSKELAKSAYPLGNHPSFCESKWFTRGWTLQELIAPKDVYFYSSEWELIGKKDDMLEVLYKVTDIHPGALKGTPMKRFSVAERMSWAAKRETTRSEDTSYCLMGIFDVNMPLLYGEGMKKAFIRLQEEIMRSSDDQSIFAWVDEKTAPDKLSGLLATDPKYFLKSKNIESIGIWAKSDPFETTNKGLRVQLYLARMDKDGKYIACLDCREPDHQRLGILAIPLQRLTGRDNEWSQSYTAQFARIRCASLLRHKHDDLKLQNSGYRTIYVRQDQDLDFQKPKLKQLSEYVRLVINEAQPSPDRVYPLSPWDPLTGLFKMRKEYDVDFSKQSKQGAALFNQSGENYLVIFGLTKSGSLWTIVCDAGSAGNPFLPYESYQSTEKEDDKWEYKDERMMPIHYGVRLKFPRKTKTMLKMTAIAKRGEHFKTPIWIVRWNRRKWQDTLLKKS